MVAHLLIAALVLGLLPVPAEASRASASAAPLPDLPLIAPPSHLALAVVLVSDGTSCAVAILAAEPHDRIKYHRARWMDPRSGRFLGMDPFEGNDDDPPSLHKYLYGGANPVNAVDPTGLESLSAQLTSFAVAVTLVAIRHPNLMAVIGAVGSALLPEEVNNAMLTSGLPGLQALGRAGQAEARAIKLIKNSASERLARREMGQITHATGHSFEEFARRRLFPDWTDKEIPINIGKRRLDLLWRQFYLEFKTGRKLDADGKAQLADFAKFVGGQTSSGFQLAYVFLEKPTRATIRAITKAGGQVFYIFD